MICICIPSRGRPGFIPQTVKKILDNANNKSNVIVKYYINDDDPDLKHYETNLKEMQTRYGDSVQYIVGPDQSPVYSWNLIAESTEADFYMLAGDEVQFKMCRRMCNSHVWLTFSRSFALPSFLSFLFGPRV